MSFVVKARVLLELGSELISSDGIALYELIKNSFDAGSDRVEIRIVLSMSESAYRKCCLRLEDAIKERGSTSLSDLKAYVASEVIGSAPVDLKAKFYERINSGLNVEDLLDRFRQAYFDLNWISITDFGSGMSLEELRENFLTIGTRSRQRKKGTGRGVVLGGKGVGRLSSMRLGSWLSVKTSSLSGSSYSCLDIDWKRFSHDSDEVISDVKVEPYVGGEKNDPSEHGTEIVIRGLSSEWSLKKLEDVAVTELAKLCDPFGDSSRFPIRLWFNTERVSIPFFQPKQLDMAHAVCNARFVPRDVLAGRPAALTYDIDYRYRDRKMSDVLSEAEIVSEADASIETVQNIGEFSVEIYWYNRLQLRENIKDPIELKSIKDFVKSWGGGLMLYRDGFRVNPYGSQDDDWLGLDPIAFKSGGYKVNRSQIVGRVSISSSGNPYLVDQTNREGLRSCGEKEAFVNLLRGILINRFKGYIESVDKSEKSKDIQDLKELESSLNDKERALLKNVRKIASDYPEAQKIVLQVEDLLQEARNIAQTAEAIKANVEEDLDKYVHLAGMGLMVEVVAHELTRATQHALESVTAGRRRDLPDDLSVIFKNLELQLKTLEKRLRGIDPLSVKGRQTKSDFDVVELVEDTLEAHGAQFYRHEIVPSFSVLGGNTGPLKIRAVKGMFIQVLENLINNSIYWLSQEKKINRGFSPVIEIFLDKTGILYVRDNGPGVPPVRKELIFEAFWSGKPGGKGKGLGLYISRQIAGYHGAKLYLSDEATAHKERLNTFVLDFQGIEK
ncbi:TPA: HAMP domain-containing histidine kinase [Pseudomonas aeruginosa]|nr:HAMP domain-containing histidine kinase [Pseudomonas aeruginosa]HCT2656894.1 HAMP domain-containing histidine kinase [Pseudomonas aeruginosa]